MRQISEYPLRFPVRALLVHLFSLLRFSALSILPSLSPNNSRASLKKRKTAASDSPRQPSLSLNEPLLGPAADADLHLNEVFHSHGRIFRFGLTDEIGIDLEDASFNDIFRVHLIEASRS